MKCTLILFMCYLTGRAHGWRYYHSKELKNWTQAREWCREKYTDMVAIQSQEENDHLVSLLPKQTGSPYYWIGITKSEKSDPWTWVGNNSTWVGNQSWATNEPNNNHITEFCVEIYVNDNKDNRGKWNDEKCSNTKYPVCYQAQCNLTSCDRGRCRETINNTICLCEPGFGGDTCQTAVTCDALSVPQHGRLQCHGSYGPSRFNSSCRFHCDLGYRVEGPEWLQCQASGRWDHPAPRCQVFGCPPLSQSLYGGPDCSDQIHAFDSTCPVGCPFGSLKLRSGQVTCSSDGTWSGPTPICINYKHAIMALAGCGAFMMSCIFFLIMKRRKNKKPSQQREYEEDMGSGNEPHS
ncbi:unnamed protein product [Arctogadus glacialis]